MIRKTDLERVKSGGCSMKAIAPRSIAKAANIAPPTKKRPSTRVALCVVVTPRQLEILDQHCKANAINKSRTIQQFIDGLEKAVQLQ